MNRILWASPLVLVAIAVLLVRSPEGPVTPPEASDAPRRVISLAPSLTELVQALDRGDRLVGVTDFCEGVSEEIPRVGGLVVEAESVIALAPDLVLAIETRAQQPLLQVLLDAGIGVQALPAESIPDLLCTITLLGEALDRRQLARELGEEITGALAAPPVTAGGPATAVFVVQRDPLLVAGGGSFVTTMLAAAGLVNAFGEGTQHYRTIEMEELMRRDPELLLDAAFDAAFDAAPDGGPGREGPMAFWGHFDRLRAVESGRVHAFPPVRPGPGIPGWVEELRRLAADRRD
ncbi:MAG: ABC transporter substrate-binding protein [Planctomycetota bacterium]|jgi:iron complex transport system substrate-binding protein